MAQVKSTNFNLPSRMPVDGRAVFLNDIGPVATNPVANDTLDFKIPPGLEISMVRFAIPAALASSGLAAKIGYAPINSGSTLTADDDYFRAAGVFGTSAGLVDCNFPPITFQEPVYLRVTWTVTATGFAAGSVYSVVGGNANGPR